MFVYERPETERFPAGEITQVSAMNRQARSQRNTEPASVPGSPPGTSLRLRHRHALSQEIRS